MSMLGDTPPGLIGALFRKNEKKYGGSLEAPGFSGSKVKNARGEWVSIDAGRKRKRDRGRVKSFMATGGQLI